MLAKVARELSVVALEALLPVVVVPGCVLRVVKARVYAVRLAARLEALEATKAAERAKAQRRREKREFARNNKPQVARLN